MRYSFHDPWMRRLFLLSRRWWSLLALLLAAKKALVWLRSRRTVIYRRFLAGHWLFVDGPIDAPVTILFVPGQTEPAYGRFNATIAQRLAGLGYRVVRFDFRPPRGLGAAQLNDTHIQHYCQQLNSRIRAICPAGPIILLGKSFGGAMATLVLDGSAAVGCVALGYPFINPMTSWDRLTHLAELVKPCWIIQGADDSYGGKSLVQTLSLSPSIQFHWIANCDHGFCPTSADRAADAILEQLHLAIQMALLELLGSWNWLAMEKPAGLD